MEYVDVPEIDDIDAEHDWMLTKCDRVGIVDWRATHETLLAMVDGLLEGTGYGLVLFNRGDDNTIVGLETKISTSPPRQS